MRFEIERHLGGLRQMQARLTTLREAGAPTLKAVLLTQAPPEFNPRDYLSYLLYIDAEIEHGLMVQYLYGAYSLGGPQVPERYRRTVQGWQEIVLGIAKEEMGHLITVQNVLRLIGAPLNLGREDYPWDTPFYPFPFMLEPFTLDSLAKYVYAESPEDWTGDLAEEVKKRVERATPNPHRVGELFAELLRVVKDPDFVPDDVFRAETYPFQASWDEWGRGYRAGNRGNSTGANVPKTPEVLVQPLASRDDAAEALTSIAQQGEACPEADLSQPSHFARFLKVYEEMRNVCKEGWAPARRVATNPYVPPSAGADPAQDQVAGQRRDPITHPEARFWGHLFNLRYRMLLHFLAHSFELEGGLNRAGAWTPRGAIINAAFGEMYNLRAIADIMVQTPLSAGPTPPGRGEMAGPPFQMPYTLNLPVGEHNRWRLHKDLLLAARPLIRQLRELAPKSRHAYLDSSSEADQRLLEIANRILAEHRAPALT